MTLYDIKPISPNLIKFNFSEWNITSFQYKINAFPHNEYTIQYPSFKFNNENIWNEPVYYNKNNTLYLRSEIDMENIKSESHINKLIYFEKRLIYEIFQHIQKSNQFKNINFDWKVKIYDNFVDEYRSGDDYLDGIISKKIQYIDLDLNNTRIVCSKFRNGKSCKSSKNDNSEKNKREITDLLGNNPKIYIQRKISFVRFELDLVNKISNCNIVYKTTRCKMSKHPFENG